MSKAKPNVFEKTVWGWVTTLGLNNHRVSVRKMSHAKLQAMNDDAEDEIVYCVTTTDWARKDHVIYYSPLVLSQPRHVIEDFALDEVLHIALSPLSEFSNRNIQKHIKVELMHAEEVTVTLLKLPLLRAFGVRVDGLTNS